MKGPSSSTSGWLLLIAVAAATGIFAGRHFSRTTASARSGRIILFYQSPMHPWVRSDKPGQCTVCGMDLVPVYQGEPGFEKPAAGLVMLPQGSPQVVGVQTAEVKKKPLVRTLRVAGMIGEDESRHGIISAPVEGRIDGLSMNHPGQQITKRQPLATMFSRTLLNAANDYKLALAQGEAAAEPHKRRLEQFGLVWEQIKSIPTRQPEDPYFGILAPMTGTIVKSYVAEGQYVKEGERLFEIADFKTMWFMFSAAEQDLPWLKVGLPVSLQTASLPGETLKARISGIDPNLDDMSHTAMVRVVVENPERRLKNKIFAEGTVDLEAPEVLVIPRTAVLWPGHAPRVYVEKGAGAYQQRELKLGRSGDAVWEVLEGIIEGERVVISGNMLIDSQAQIEALAAPAVTMPDTHAPAVASDTAMDTFLKSAAALGSALASDDLAAANAAAAQLTPPPTAIFKSPVPHSAPDLKALRQVFLPWSQELATLAAGLTPRPDGLKIFNCPMTGRLWAGAPAGARWIQFTPEPRNPYWGAEMLDCGVEIKP